MTYSIIAVLSLPMWKANHWTLDLSMDHRLNKLKCSNKTWQWTSVICCSLQDEIQTQWHKRVGSVLVNRDSRGKWNLHQLCVNLYVNSKSPMYMFFEDKFHILCQIHFGVVHLRMTNVKRQIYLWVILFHMENNTKIATAHKQNHL